MSAARRRGRPPLVEPPTDPLASLATAPARPARFVPGDPDMTACLAGDVDARNRVAMRHVGLVRSVIRANLGSGAVTPDRVQDGMVAIIGALETYDPAKGSVATHLVWAVRGSLTHRWRKEKRHVGEVRLIGTTAADGDGESAPYDPGAVTPEPLDGPGALCEALALAIEATPRDRRAIAVDIARRILLSDDPVTLETVGRAHGKSREWVRVSRDALTARVREIVARERARR